MVALWRTRLRQHVQEQQKYLRLVFNDHFVLVLLILLVVPLYACQSASENIATILVVSFVSGCHFYGFNRAWPVSHVGAGARSSLLTAKTEAFGDYLLKARRYSMMYRQLYWVLRLWRCGHYLHW